ncbi:MAG: hypothetical protein LBM96_08585 [Methanobrevibacter sp.]|jgi:hypothetical protein|nr:hypothetical protein [Candidatus Methanoflexus mossambicus]
MIFKFSRKVFDRALFIPIVWFYILINNNVVLIIIKGVDTIKFEKGTIHIGSDEINISNLFLDDNHTVFSFYANNDEDKELIMKQYSFEIEFKDNYKVIGCKNQECSFTRKIDGNYEKIMNINE